MAEGQQVVAWWEEGQVVAVELEVGVPEGVETAAEERVAVERAVGLQAVEAKAAVQMVVGWPEAALMEVAVAIMVEGVKEGAEALPAATMAARPRTPC